MILLLAVYLAGVVGLLCIIDHRLRAAQLIREDFVAVSQLRLHARASGLLL